MPEQARRSRAEALWAAVRKASEKAPTPGSMVLDLFGVTRRGTPNSKEAAERLGVSQRTVQRWIKQGMPMRSSAAADLAQQHGSWRSSPGGRRARLSTRRESRLRNKGTQMVFYGKVRVSSDVRKRGTTVTVDPERMGQILDASLAGNDQLALGRLEDAFGDAFGGSVTLVEIDKLDTFG
ncbi:MAG: helix-turn-helix domain-containing protein [Nocardioides sp.]